MQQAADDEMAVLQQRMTELLGLPGLKAGASSGADESAKLQLLQAMMDAREHLAAQNEELREHNQLLAAVAGGRTGI